jgi:hypothetical protein
MFQNKKKLKESILKLKEKYPDRIPVYICKSKTDKILPQINNNKFIVPENSTVKDLLYIVRKRIQLDSSISMFFFVNENVLPPSSDTIGSLYSQYKNEDELLIINYCGENTFGI